MDYKWTQSEEFQARKIIYVLGRMLRVREWRQTKHSFNSDSSDPLQFAASLSPLIVFAP